MILVVSFMIANLASAAPTPQWIKNLPAARNANQLIVVAQAGEKTTA